MFVYYKSQGISLLDKLNELWNKYGYCLTTLHSYEFPGETGFKRMNEIMNFFRNENVYIPGFAIKEKQDYINGLNGLPKSDVIKMSNDKYSLVFRPSGTEPKLKVYLSINTGSKEDALKIEKELSKNIETLIFE